MHHNSTGPAMSQKIFSMNLEVETVSLYLLCCAVADGGAGITRTILQEKWNGDQITLERELSRLIDRNILDRDAEAEEGGETVYRVVDEKKWR